MAVHSMWSLLLVAGLLGLEPHVNPAPMFLPRPPFPRQIGPPLGFRGVGPIGYRRFPPPFFNGPSFNNWNFIPRQPYLNMPLIGYRRGVFPQPGYIGGFQGRMPSPVNIGWNRYGIRPAATGYQRNVNPVYKMPENSPQPMKKMEMGRHVSPFENTNILKKVNPYPTQFKTMNRMPSKFHSVAKAKNFNSLIQ